VDVLSLTCYPICLCHQVALMPSVGLRVAAFREKYEELRFNITENTLPCHSWFLGSGKPSLTMNLFLL
jgi:hypothetical protein